MDYEIVIGLEVHIHLNTASKMFCGCSTKFGGQPNTQTCPVCLGLPGVLPVINEKAVVLAIKTALALNCKIARFTKFDRKHYFYPDLPKNFQISQYDKPLSYEGFLEIDVGSSVKKIGLTRIHLEEDAGKLIHREHGDSSMVDYNRTGIPLLEVVTEPDLRSPQEAYEFLVTLKNSVEYLDVSDCNMEEGSLRCDANISVRPLGQKTLGVKTEIKNMNSFKAVRLALEYESGRQIGLLGEGKEIVQETRLWDGALQATSSMRSKEEAHDYRYFPEPDLLPIVPDEMLIEETMRGLPEMPRRRRQRLIEIYELSEYDASILAREKKLADFFEETVREVNKPKIVVNWITGDLLGILNEKGLSLGDICFGPGDLAQILTMIGDGTLSGKQAKELLKEAVETKKRPADIVKQKGLSQITDEAAIEGAVDKVLSMNQKAAGDFKAGKEAALAFLVGQVMKETKGKASPAIVNQTLRKRLI